MTGLWELLALLLVIVLMSVVVVAIEAVIAIRALLATQMPRAGVAIMLGGLLVGLPYGGFLWVMQPSSNIYLVIASLASLAVLGLAIVVGVGLARSWRAVAVLAAGVLFQFGAVGGALVVPQLPIIGPLLEDARCERDPFCRADAHIPDTGLTEANG